MSPKGKQISDYYQKVADILIGSSDRTGVLLTYDEMLELYDYTLKKSDGKYPFGSMMFLVLLENEIDDFAMRYSINFRRNTVNA